MNAHHLADALEGKGPAERAELVGAYLIPHETTVTEDRIGHDLAPDTLEFARGHFLPASDKVMIDVDAAYAFWGNARAALLLVVGQPETPGATLYDSGGAPVPGARWYSMASVNGESAWASTTHRRIVVDVDPSAPVTWQLVGAITGGAETTPVPGPARIAITPDGTRAFVTSPEVGTVTPVALGRPGYSVHNARTVEDVGLDPVETGESPQRLTADDTHVVVCHEGEAGRVVILSASTHEVLHRVAVPGGSPADCALTPDGTEAVVTSASGHVARISLDSGEVIGAELGGRPLGVAVAHDGRTAYVADAASDVVHRVALPDLGILATIPVAQRPHVVRIAPDGRIWVLCDPSSGVGQLDGIDPDADAVVVEHALPFPRPTDLAIVPVAGQSSPVVRTAWVVFEDSRFCQQLIGGRFEGEPHSFHHGSFGNEGDGPASIAVSDYGEIWVTQPSLDRVWKWPGGRLVCRADASRPHSGVFFGEYCTVAVYGARSAGAGAGAGEGSGVVS